MINDPTLAVFVKFTEEGLFSGVHVTLTVSSGIVSGTIASTAEYGEWVKSLINKATFNQVVAPSATKTDVAKRLLTETFPDATALDALPGAPEVPSGEDDKLNLDPDQLRFIHLRDASIWIGGPTKSAIVPFWRGRLDFVSGWAFGLLESG